MNSRERIRAIFEKQPIDRAGLFEAFWQETLPRWSNSGKINQEKHYCDTFQLDLDILWSYDLRARPYFTEEIIEEDEETYLAEDGNFALLRHHKKHTSTPEHVAYKIQTEEDYRQWILPELTVSERRINPEEYRNFIDFHHRNGRAAFVGGVGIFENLHLLLGHENLLLNMALEPEWIKSIADRYADVLIGLLQMLLDSHPDRPDGLWLYEDLGFKERPFMSPATYRTVLFDAHKKINDFAHRQKLYVVYHSCGFVEPLLPDMVQSGIDGLQGMENKAGMNPLRILDNYPELVLIGGFDVRNLTANNQQAIAEEQQQKLAMLQSGRYILSTDHSIPPECSYETYRFFVENGLKLSVK